MWTVPCGTRSPGCTQVYNGMWAWHPDYHRHVLQAYVATHDTCLQITALISAAISQKACRFPSVFSTMSGYTLAGKFQWFSRCQKCRPTDKGCTPHSHMVLKVNQWKSQPLIQHVSLTSLLPHHVGLSRLTCTPEITLEIKGARKRLSFISSTQ